MSEPSSPILKHFSDLIDTRGDDVMHWLDLQRQETRPLIYTSVDLRHAGYKLAPVDTNLYPAGFNNLSALGKHRAVAEFRHFFRMQPGEPKRALIIPENHTRNLGYLENLHVLSGLLEKAGLEVKIGSLAAQGEPLVLDTLSGEAVTEWPLIREGDSLRASDGFVPDALVLNNDFTAGPSPLLAQLKQPCFPPMEMGWWKRRKSEHFTRFCLVAEDFAAAFGFDPWLLCPHFHRMGVVDFEQKPHLDKLAAAADAVLAKIRESYALHGVKEEPYVYVKADSGTYGMGIMTARSGEELLQLNKKTRNKMKTIKEGARNTEVIIQEGIPTIDRVKGAPAEPMIYLVAGEPVGGAYRTNPQRDALNNLNAAGVIFTGMCDESESDDCSRVSVAGCDFGAFGLVARLAALAAGRENYTDFDFAI
jgi:glutamate--cysteine ligase